VIHRRRFTAAAGAAGVLAGAGLWPRARAQPAPPAAGTALARVRERGRLVIALYHDHPPFHVAGQGIEVELANALAARLGVAPSLLPFNADENMNDDLRNMVWRGHYLGFGPADVMLHVPVDRPLIDGQPRVQIFAPYFRERVMLAHRLDAVPRVETVADLAGRPIAVPGQSLAGWLLIGAEGGALREQLRTKLKDGVAAARALLAGEVPVAAGHASELESVLRGDARFALAPLPVPRLREGWAVGMAVKREAQDLAQALQAAVNGLAEGGELAAMFARGGVSWKRA
jgi:ABC-type amino acid transport substrate-binding protein